jgi:hypothetical protein
MEPVVESDRVVGVDCPDCLTLREQRAAAPSRPDHPLARAPLSLGRRLSLDR